MWYLPLCLYTLRQFSSFRRSQSPPFFSWLFIFFFLSSLPLLNLPSRIFHSAVQRPSLWGAVTHDFLLLLLSLITQFVHPSPSRPSGFVEIQLSAAWCMLCGVGLWWCGVLIFSLQSALLLLLPFSVPVLLCPAFSPYFHPPSILLYQLWGSLSVLCSPGPTA